MTFYVPLCSKKLSVHCGLSVYSHSKKMHHDGLCSLSRSICHTSSKMKADTAKFLQRSDRLLPIFYEKVTLLLDNLSLFDHIFLSIKLFDLSKMMHFILYTGFIILAVYIFCFVVTLMLTTVDIKAYFTLEMRP